MLYKIKHVRLLKLKIKLLVFNFMTKRYVDSRYVDMFKITIAKKGMVLHSIIFYCWKN